MPTDPKMVDLPKTLNGMPVLGPVDPDASPADPNERPRYLRTLLKDDASNPFVKIYKGSRAV